jgi:TMEM175 potassium channel family protein
MNAGTTDEVRAERECSRIEAFSDGVFAIAITLLVLDLVQIPPGAAGQNLIQVYLPHWERFLAFVVGFCTILVCWINHHHMFLYIRRFDSRLMWLNGFLLLLVTFAPFPTAILAQYINHSASGAVPTFGFGYFLMAFAYSCLWSYAYSHDLLVRDGDRDFFLAIRTTYRYASIYNLLAFFICFLSIPLAIVLYLLMFAVFAFPKEFATRLSRERAARKQGQELPRRE